MKLARSAAMVLLSSVLAAPSATAQSGAPVGPRTAPSSTAPPFQRGVPTGTATPDAIRLSIVEAVDRALTHNLGYLNAEHAAARTEGDRWEALSELLPNVMARVSETRQQINLAAFGFPLPAGIPSVVGPFNVFDARLLVTQPVFDLHALHALRAESHNKAAAAHTIRSARDAVVLVVSTLYLQALAATARVESVEAQLQTAQAIFEQAQHLKESGIVAGIDVLRAEVQLGSQQQRVAAARNDFEKSKLVLARAIGLPAGQRFTLSPELPTVPTTASSIDEALEQAFRRRPDYLAAQERLRAAEADRRAAAAEYLPSVRVAADYGTLGRTVSDAASTYSVLGSVVVPIFNGGRTRGHVLQADADLRARQAELADVRSGIDFDVRAIFLDLKTTAEQLVVATRSRELATQQLTQARDRFAAGVASNIEVVQAQQAVATASEEYISSLYNNDIMRALLASTLGLLEERTSQGSGGNR